MKRVCLILGFVASVFVFTGCNKEINLGTLNQFNQKVLFQYERINYAWGFQHSGWFADSTGKIYTYNLPSGWNFCNANETLTEEEMESNLSKCILPGLYFPQSTLYPAYTLFKSAGNGFITDPVHEMCDAGAWSYSCFIFDPVNKTYKKVLLKETGDWRIENSSNAAKEILKVMQQITDELVKNQKL